MADVHQGLLSLARDAVVGNQTATVSFLQRTLKLNYWEAVDLMEALEAEGIVEWSDAESRREVLWSADDLATAKAEGRVS